MNTGGAIHMLKYDILKIFLSKAGFTVEQIEEMDNFTALQKFYLANEKPQKQIEKKRNNWIN